MGYRQNIRMFKDTMSALGAGGYAVGGHDVRIPASLAVWREVRVFPASEVQRLVARAEQPAEDGPGGGCAIEVTMQDSFTAAEDLVRTSSDGSQDEKPPLVLNFANPVEPGGGVTRGAQAQEEDLCRRSSLYLSISSVEAEPYYQENERAHPGLFTHNALLSPHVQVFRASDGTYLGEPFEVAVLTVAAPYVPYTATVTSAELTETIETRVRGMLSIAEGCGYERLVLGAWGCGAFGNDPERVAEAFRGALADFAGFRIVRFAIPGPSHNHKVFARVLS